MLRLDFCYYSNSYIAVKETMVFLAGDANENDKVEKNFAFKNDAPFRSCISKINSTLIGNAEDLDIVMPMYNLLEYYYRNEMDDADDNAPDGKSFKYKTKIVGKTPARPGDAGDADRPAVPTSNVEVTIPLKYLGKFWIFFDLPLINCEIELDLSRTKDCVLIEHNRGKLTYNNITGLNFMITSTKRYVPVVTLSINDNINFFLKI